jgi:hypothetical protein
LPRTTSPEALAQQVSDALELQEQKLAAQERALVEIVNGTRLVVRANAPGQETVTQLLQALRRLADLAVFVDTRLYEVDAAFYKKLKSVKRVPLEELEQRFLAGAPAPADSLFKQLAKQELVLTGDRVKLDDGAEAGLLSRRRAVRCLPSPEQVQRGEKRGQVVFEGFAFTGKVHVSSDRRFVRLTLTEKATQVQEIKKVTRPDRDGKDLYAEVPLLQESTYTQELEIPDGGSILVPVRFRPAAAQAKDRWWVLYITARLRIEEEEELMRRQSLDVVLPKVIADVLQNARLKSARDHYGSPGATGFALIDSAAWTWPEKLKTTSAGHQPPPQPRAGPRLLGIRLDRIDEAGQDDGPLTLSIALVNAGGEANGAAVGAGTLCYRARPTGKGWAIELAE